jgi:hypothetical protein
MSKPTALELALVAAVLDPELAKAEPGRAVRIASKLISAAQKEIEHPDIEVKRKAIALLPKIHFA